MPGRIRHFGRSPQSSTPSVNDLSSSASSTTTSSTGSTTTTTTISSLKSLALHAEFAATGRRPAFAMDHLKRHSLGGRPSSLRTSSPKLAPAKPATLEISMESPPLTFYGTAQNSTGALLSGQIHLTVLEPEVTFQKFDLRLQATITAKKPVVKDCPDCTTKVNDLNRWEFLREPVTLKHGEHSFPFSFLLPGHLPATTRGSLGVIEYALAAKATTALADVVALRHPLDVSRAIIQGNDKTCVRIFPPTNLTARVVLPPVIHPIGLFPVTMTVDGIVDHAANAQTRWRLRKLNWRIEEHQRMVSPACARHANKVGGEGKGVLHQDSRIVGSNELKTGWKTDFDTAGGQIDLEFEAGIRPGLNALCDVESPTGLEVKHNFVVELIVAEEFCPNKNTRLVTPTGAARVLRMQFSVFVTERSGLGISWDEEMPPVYSDVPASPPMYHATSMEDYGGPPLEYEELERLDRREDASPARRSGSIPRRNLGSGPGGLNGPADERRSGSHPRGRRMRLITTDDLETVPAGADRPVRAEMDGTPDEDVEVVRSPLVAHTGR